jgi:hypothetical protein
MSTTAAIDAPSPVSTMAPGAAATIAPRPSPTGSSRAPIWNSSAL